MYYVYTDLGRAAGRAIPNLGCGQRATYTKEELVQIFRKRLREAMGVQHTRIV